MRKPIMVILVLVAVPLFAAEQKGFAKRDQPAARSYTQDPADLFGPAGGAINIKRVLKAAAKAAALLKYARNVGVS